MKRLILFLLIVGLVGCNPFKKEEPKEEPPKQEEVKPTPKPEPTIEDDAPTAIVLESGWKKEYEKILSDKIKSHGPNLLKYKNDVGYWVKLFCGTAGAESAYKPWTTYWEKELGVSCLSVWDKARCEKFVANWNKKQKYSSRYAYIDRKGWDRVTKTFYLSEGLLQLSYSDKKYYGCDFDWEKDQFKLDDDHEKSIFDPKKNLECGVVILNRLVGKKGTPFFNSGHYWAVLKPSNKRHKDFKWYRDNKCGS